MTGVNPAPIDRTQPQLTPATGGATPPSAELVATASATKNCMDMFLNAFSESFSAVALVEGDTTELENAAIIQEKGTNTQAQGTAVEEQAKAKETTNVHAENELRAQRAVALKAGMDDSQGAPTKTYVANIVDGQLQLKSAASMTKPELEEAHDAHALVFKHDNILGLSPKFCATLGYKDGQQISYIDEDGKKHTLTIHHFDDHEMNHFSSIVSVCLSQISEDTREEAAESKEDSISKSRGKPTLTTNHTISVLNRNDRRDEKENIQQDKGQQNGATQTSHQIAVLENITTENVRDRLHDAHELSEFIAKLISIIVADFQKFDIQNQGLKLDNLKNDHEFIVLPRSILAH